MTMIEQYLRNCTQFVTFGKGEHVDFVTWLREHKNGFFVSLTTPIMRDVVIDGTVLGKNDLDFKHGKFDHCDFSHCVFRNIEITHLRNCSLQNCQFVDCTLVESTGLSGSDINS